MIYCENYMTLLELLNKFPGDIWVNDLITICTIEIDNSQPCKKKKGSDRISDLLSASGALSAALTVRA